jgi:hypothetical protein
LRWELLVMQKLLTHLLFMDNRMVVGIVFTFSINVHNVRKFSDKRDIRGPAEGNIVTSVCADAINRFGFEQVPDGPILSQSLDGIQPSSRYRDARSPSYY